MVDEFTILRGKWRYLQSAQRLAQRESFGCKSVRDRQDCCGGFARVVRPQATG